MTQLDEGLSLPARIFIDENSSFLWTSALISLLSVCFGHMVYVITLNGGYSTSKGTIMQIPYFFISVAARVFYILLFITPFLGLFDVSYHGTEGFKWQQPSPKSQVFEITGNLRHSWLVTTIPKSTQLSRKWDRHNIRRCVE